MTPDEGLWRYPGTPPWQHFTLDQLVVTVCAPDGATFELPLSMLASLLWPALVPKLDSELALALSQAGGVPNAGASAVGGDG